MRKFAIGLIASTILVGCGGGGGSSPSGSGGGSSITGKVADGYIQGAVVFWDCNGNKSLDSGETQAITGVGGAFTIANAPQAGCTLVAKVPSGAIDEDSPSTPISTPYTLVSTSGNETFISPISTLVSAHMAQNPTVSQTDAEKAVAGLLGITGNLNSDYITEQTNDSVKRRGLAKITAVMLQNTAIPGNASDSIAAGYTKVQEQAPAIGAIDLGSNGAIDNFLNPFKGFIQPSSPNTYRNTSTWYVRPNGGLGLTDAQLNIIDALISQLDTNDSIRDGVINFNQLTSTDLVSKVRAPLVTNGILNVNGADAVNIRSLRDSELQSLENYRAANIASKNTFFNTDIAANMQFITQVGISSVEAVSGAVSTYTGLPSVDLRPLRSMPALKNTVKTIKTYKIGDVVLTLLKGLNASGKALSADETAALTYFGTSNADGKNITADQFKALGSLLSVLVDTSKDMVKKKDFGIAAKLFGPSLTIYNATTDCSGIANEFSDECFVDALSLLESVSEWVHMGSRIQGILLWTRTTMDAYIAGKEYDKTTSKVVSTEQDKVIANWNAYVEKRRIYWYLQELSVSGLDSLFSAYDPTIPCATNQTRKHGVCVSNQPSAYTVNTLTGSSADSSIALFSGGGAGFMSNIHTAPNDAGVAYGISNYSQGGATKVGVFFLNQPSGLWYLTEESSFLLASNDLGQAVVARTNAQALPTTSNYYFISKANDGSMYKLYLPAPSGALSIIGLLKNGNIVGVQGANTIIYDKTMQPITTINTIYNGVGGDGLMFGVDFQQNKIVRFSDGTQGILPCNIPTGQTDLSMPSTGRNCSNIVAANSSGTVIGSYYSADGSRGVFKYSKSGFVEVPIPASYFGYGGASSNQSPPRPVGIADSSDILLAPIYSDQYQQTCTGGPYVLSGTTMTDLKQYIPSNSCFNIQAGISGGGKIYMSSQWQGLNFYLQKN